MDLQRTLIVFDTDDLATESTFWARVLGGRVDDVDADWHNVYDAAGQLRMAAQLAPGHRRPQWPDGAPQQIHLDLHVADQRAAHDEVMALGATVLKEADLSAAEGFQVYADPAGHPFCICWGE